MTQLTFSLEEHHANHSQSQDSEKDWTTLVVTSCLPISELLTTTNPSGSFGKMFQVSSVQREDGILVPSSGRWSNSGMGSPTECWTLNTSEFHKDAEESLLSHILETGDLPQRFFLSEKACKGILRLAEERGRELPSALKVALQTVAQQSEVCLPETTKE